MQARAEFRKLPDEQYLWECFEYDEGDGALIWAKRPVHHFVERAIHQPPESICKMWNAQRSGKPFGSNYRDTIIGKIDNQSYYAHRIIWKMVYGSEPIDIIHLNGVRTDNALANLMVATKEVRNKLGYGTGVCKRMGNWIAYMSYERKQIVIGTFDNKADAISCRLTAMKNDKEICKFALSAGAVSGETPVMLQNTSTTESA